MMTAHDHRQHVDGCYRCELSQHEVIGTEVADAIRPHARRLAEEAPAVTYLHAGYGYALVRATEPIDGTYRMLATAVLVAHQRKDLSSCLCGWSELGKSHAAHVAETLDAAGALRGAPNGR